MDFQSCIRNFAIIAHIDHGKSTLADRLLELTGTVTKREMQEQLLDSNPIERERGITIKLAPVRMVWNASMRQRINASTQITDTLTHRHADTYILNLIDTPGHVDFGYEVSRSLAACEGAVLVVDATQGVQAQTLANLHQARAHNLTIIPVINKIDMPTARIEVCVDELCGMGFRKEEILKISAKTGENVKEVLEAVVARIPSPKGVPDGTLRALVFSSHYDTHKGVVVFVRVVDGEISASVDELKFFATGMEITPIEIGYFSPKMIACDVLRSGEVGYIATGLKDVRLAKVGDTITSVNSVRVSKASVVPLPGYKEPKSMVFLGLFPMSADEYEQARESMEKLRLSDSAFTFRPISSLALGNGFHCGFLGLLHAEVVQERILREFGLTMLATSPSVEYRLRLVPGVDYRKLGFTQSSVIAKKSEAIRAGSPCPDNNRTRDDTGTIVSIQSAGEYPDPSQVARVEEPMMRVEIYSPKLYVGAIMQLSQEKRGTYMDLVYEGDQAHFTYLIPLSEMIVDFFDRLKSVSEGYASLDYEFFDWAEVEVAKVDLLVNKEKVDALSYLITRDAAVTRSRELVERLAAVIPRQQYEIPIQAAIGGSVIARADVKAFRKDVTKKLYGGDRTRKDKLLDKQKKGKARMKRIGSVEIPQSAFFVVLKREG